MNNHLQPETYTALLNSFTDPVVFVDTEHIIRFVNHAAITHYKKWGNILGKNLLDCHNENSKRLIKEGLNAFEKGDTQIIISENDERRVFMRSVRNNKGELIGYFESYERFYTKTS